MDLIERDACGIGFVADREGRASSATVETALEALRRMRHRGALAADAKSGDGAGLLTPIPRALFGGRGVAMLFLPPDRRDECAHLVESSLGLEGIEVAGWRAVPVDPSALGGHARETMPDIAQLLLEPPKAGDAELLAFRARKRIETEARAAGLPLYASSLSYSSVTYKALCAADQLGAFYADLVDPSFEVAFAIFHQRYSTNTAPTWERAQPFRFLCHNGEINTIQGNVLGVRAKESHLVGGDRILPPGLLRPVIDESGSDSSMLDNVVELLVRGGRSLDHAFTMLIPAAWEGRDDLNPAVVDFYRYHAFLTEPWDGPAALVFTDGRVVGACLDRNGLRPLRYAIADDGLVYCGSEIGAVDLGGHGRIRRGRLGPGEMLFVDPARREMVVGDEVKTRLAARQPYGAWLGERLVVGGAGDPDDEVPLDVVRLQSAFGYTKEEITVVLRPMAATGAEPISSMGDDTALPPLANRWRSVFGHVKQRFAQVTNPPIDHLHEREVMSLANRLGRGSFLADLPLPGPVLELPSFFLYADGLERLRRGPWMVADVDATFAIDGGLEDACKRLADEAELAVRAGTGVIVVSDVAVGPERVPVPILLAVGAVDERLVKAGLRGRASLAVDTGEAREVHHVACLLGYGADAVVPRLALQTVAELTGSGRLAAGVTNAGSAQRAFRRALEEGVLKVMSKMGISTLDAYRGARLFECVGLSKEVVDLCLAGTPASYGGVGFAEIEHAVRSQHAAAFGDRAVLVNPGFVKHRAGGEYHATNPEIVASLHELLELPRRGTARGDVTSSPTGLDGAEERSAGGRAVLERAVAAEDLSGYDRFASLVDGRPPTELRDLIQAVPHGPTLPLDEVESAFDIARRFSSGAMSHGALSAEAHETIARGLALIGARANTGEGGEDPARYRSDANSPIKQVASARFGVTPEYCVFAEELQIKIAQGSKPGEGGQLPGHKVTDEIARLRHTTPGMTLISPPPHHDIYSIEDLAQLIYDLKQVNPEVAVSVKLVSTAGVGVVATGVAKGLADVVHIAGSDGGTGASPLSSIKSAGLPWELGLAEAQEALVGSGLRHRVRVRVDGGLKTGRDVVIAALMGADEFSFGTAALLAEGCIMVRACHRDTCPTGIATQRPELRLRFAGTSEQVAAYFMYVAHDVRRHLAALGLRSLKDAVGRRDLLRHRPGTHDHRLRLDVSSLVDRPSTWPRRFIGPEPIQRPCSPLGDLLTVESMPALIEGAFRELHHRITNQDRTVGARLGGALARRFGSATPPGRVRVYFRGEAGQSFGAFLSHGVELRLQGEANDYVGKGMAGGRIAIRAPDDDAGDPVLVGNTALYGATGGELYCAGRAGERFAVRNSGALAVVEGTGDHACEYMTGGTVVVLGPVGRNLGAGMSGGRCFVHDPNRQIEGRVNHALVSIKRPSREVLEEIEAILDRHLRMTGSERAFRVLSSWVVSALSFRMVEPMAAPHAPSGLARDPGSRREVVEAEAMLVVT